MSRSGALAAWPGARCLRAAAGRTLAIAVFLFSQFASASPRTVEYILQVRYFTVDLECQGPVWVQGVNGILPGPLIRVRRYDRLRMVVENQLQVEPITIHLHGFEHRHSQEYDGAMGITQCGIQPNTTFVYDYVVDEMPGTYMYHEHAHLDHVAARGLMGIVIVDPEEGATPLWSYDQEAVIDMSDWWPKSPKMLELLKMGYATRPNTQSLLGNDVGLIEFHNILIGGKGAYNVFREDPDARPGWINNCTSIEDLFHVIPVRHETWRLRLANAGVMYAMRFRIDGHRMRVIQTDAADTELSDPYDAITLSSGERFDVLVTFDQEPGSYWMRVETLEAMQGRLLHGQLGVVRYSGTAAGVEPTLGLPRWSPIEASPQLITLGCVDQEPTYSATCRPVTELRRHSSTLPQVEVGIAVTRQYEVGLRGFRGQTPSHFTRLVEMPNPFAEDQFQGEYVQFHSPYVPYSHVGGGHEGEHPNTLTMVAQDGDVVRIVLQWMDRVAHPWHLHGHKFAVLAVGFPDYPNECGIPYCRSDGNADGGFNRWLTIDGLGPLLHPREAPIKDTVHVPAGGWAVIQFKADNPGWWLFHCHMAVHLHDGMGMVLVEGTDVMPPRLTNLTYYAEKGFPTCEHELHHLERHGNGHSCPCWQDPQMLIQNKPYNSYRCSQPYLCEEPQELDPLHSVDVPYRPYCAGAPTARDRASGWPWRYTMAGVWSSFAFLLLFYKAMKRAQAKKFAEFLQGFSEELGAWWDFQQRADSMDSEADDYQDGNMVRHGVSDGSFSTPPTPVLKPTVLEKAPTAAPSSKALHSTVLAGLKNWSSASNNPDMGIAQAKLAKEHMSAAERDRPPCYKLPFEFEAREEVINAAGRQSLFSIGTQSGCSLRGSLFMIMGMPPEAKPWIHFFAGRAYKSNNIRIRGNMRLDGIRLNSLSRKQMRLVRSFVSNLEKTRPDCTVLQSLKFVVKLAKSPGYCSNRMQRDYRLGQIINLFGLKEHLWTQVKDLSPDIFLKMEIAKQCLPPRAILILDDPLASLGQAHAVELMATLAKLCKHWGITIIFSGASLMGPAGNHISHILLCRGLDKSPVFGDLTTLKKFCFWSGRALPENKTIVEWCTELGLVGDWASPKFFKTMRRMSSVNTMITKLIGWETNDATNRSSVCSDGAVSIVMDWFGSTERSPVRSNSRSGMLLRLFTRRISECDDSAKENGDGEEDFTGHAFLREVSHRQKRFHSQLLTLIRHEFETGLSENVTWCKVLETFSLGIGTGLVWFGRGGGETQMRLNETVGLLFFTTALWTVPSVFSGLASAPGVYSRARAEYLCGLYHINALVLAFAVANFLTAAVWAAVWQILAYSLANVGESWISVLKMQMVLMLNSFTMRTIGWVIGTICRDNLLNTVVCNFFAQMCMLTNGFYTSLEPWLQWVTFFSIPCYTFRALLKLEYKWTDTFEVHPYHGIPAFGYPTKYIPAELTGMFQIMSHRHMDIMRSPEEKTIIPEVVSLLCLSCFLVLCFALALLWRLRALEEVQPEADVEVPGQPWDFVREEPPQDFIPTSSEVVSESTTPEARSNGLVKLKSSRSELPTSTTTFSAPEDIWLNLPSTRANYVQNWTDVRRLRLEFEAESKSLERLRQELSNAELRQARASRKLDIALAAEGDRPEEANGHRKKPQQARSRTMNMMRSGTQSPWDGRSPATSVNVGSSSHGTATEASGASTHYGRFNSSTSRLGDQRTRSRQRTLAAANRTNSDLQLPHHEQSWASGSPVPSGTLSFRDDSGHLSLSIEHDNAAISPEEDRHNDEAVSV